MTQTPSTFICTCTVFTKSQHYASLTWKKSLADVYETILIDAWEFIIHTLFTCIADENKNPVFNHANRYNMMWMFEYQQMWSTRTSSALMRNETCLLLCTREKQDGNNLLLSGTVVYHRDTTSLKFTSTNLYTWVERNRGIFFLMLFGNHIFPLDPTTGQVDFDIFSFSAKLDLTFNLNYRALI